MNESLQPVLTEEPGDVGQTVDAIDGGSESSSWVDRTRAEVTRLHALAAVILASWGIKGRAVTLHLSTIVYGIARNAGVSGGATGIVAFDGPCNFEKDYKGEPNPRVGERKITLRFDELLTIKGKPALFSFYYADMADAGHVLGGYDEGTKPVMQFADHLYNMEQKLEAWEDRQDAS